MQKSDDLQIWLIADLIAGQQSRIDRFGDPPAHLLDRDIPVASRRTHNQQGVTFQISKVVGDGIETPEPSLGGNG